MKANMLVCVCIHTHTHIYIYISRQLLAHGDYSYIFNCRTKILAKFRGMFIIFCGISKQLCIYSTLFLGTPNDVLWDP